MEMSAAEVKAFWRSYCRRRKVDDKVIELGEKKIDQDPEYWADHTMDELMAQVAPRSGTQ